MQGINILIVDDDEHIYQMLTDILQSEDSGYLVESALTAEDGIKTAKSRYFNIAIIDIMLPDMDGIQLLKEIKKIEHETYCIMATAHASLNNPIKALNEGAYPYMLKPLELAEVLLTIKRALAEQELIKMLEASEKMHREFVENSPYGILRISVEDGTVISANSSCCRLFESECEDLLKRSAFEFFVDPENQKKMVGLLEKKGKFNDLELSVMSNTGEHKTVSCTSRAIYNNKGQLDEAELMLSDITEKKVLERHLIESEAKYRDLVENSAELIFRTDIDSNLTFINEKQFKESLGYDREELLGKSFFSIIHNEDVEKVSNAFHESMKAGRLLKKSIEYRAVSKEGGIQYHLTYGTPIFDDNGKVGG